jgi:hypothetical protein
MSKIYASELAERRARRTLIFFPLQVMHPVLLRVYFGRFRWPFSTLGEGETTWMWFWDWLLGLA